MADISDKIRQSWANGSPTDWFEIVYTSAAKGEGNIPWAHMQPAPELIDWLNSNHMDGTGKTALVIACGLGDDAVALAEQGFEVTAFDVSESAIAWCQERFQESKVNFMVADLLNPPEDWRGKFDFVLENRTVQALPYQLHAQAIASIASFVKDTVLILCHGRAPEEEARGIPWPLSKTELAEFAKNGLTEKTFKDFSKHGLRRFVVEYRRV